VPEGNCPFCGVSEERIAFATEWSLAIWDGYPVTEGHLLIVPRRHVAVWKDLESLEIADLVNAVGQAQQLLRDRYRIDGINVGFNEGAAAGQTVPHFHVHIIPRRVGDMPDPRGGVRHVIPQKGNYDRIAAVVHRLENDSAPHDRALIAGVEDPLLHHLLPHIQQAHSVDVTVAFVMDSGVRLLQPHLQELLDRGGRLRLVAGDYLGVTDPSALRRLLDLDGDVRRWMFEADLISFHPKSWIFHSANGGGIAIVGSSNLSETALSSGVEWNCDDVRSSDGATGSVRRDDPRDH
jgi:diadenosine tetraphosphate (Ap4A) HIT family hydrolase